LPTTPCPDRDQLLGYLLGQLPDDSSEQIAIHLDECPTCEATAETLDQVSDTLVSELERPVVPSRFDNEPQYQQALQCVLAQAGRESASASGRDSSAGSVSAILSPLGEYELLAKLGEGGMGAVYKARQTNLDRLVALKVLPIDRSENQAAIARFYREMRAVGRLSHPNIVQAHDAREIEGSPVLAMEYVDGLDLAKLISATGPLRIEDACELVRQTAVGLQHAHEQGLVHRDIKPSNLMLTTSRASSLSQGEDRGGVVKILDLGLALLSVNQPHHPEMTAAGAAMGTADYISPEQVTDSHAVDIRSDIYSLGCTLYKLLSGQAPFVGPQYKNDVTKMMAHVQQTPPPITLLRTDLPPGFAAVIERMMAKKPEDRFATPGEVATVLGPFTVGCDLERLLNEANGRLGLPTVETSRSASTGKLSASAHSDTDSPLAPIGWEAVQPSSPLAPVLRGEGSGVRGRGPAGRGSSRRRTATIVAIALALVGAIWLGVVLLRVKTPEGTIVIEADQLEIAGAVVEVDGQQRVTIDPGKGQERVTVVADEQEHLLRVTKGGFETYTKKFTLKAGETQTLTVRLEPTTASGGRQPPDDSARPARTDLASGGRQPPDASATANQPATAKTKPLAPTQAPHAVRGGHTADADSWEPGPLYNVLSGFIQRPARLPGIKRWQVISVAPRDQILSIDWSAAV
jgi:serine/threonine protein kinase